MAPSTKKAIHTVPTGFSTLPPPGPAMPDTATAHCAPSARAAPRAMARTTGSLTAPWAASNASGTPSTPLLTALA
jgi:hypothetical protein